MPRTRSREVEDAESVRDIRSAPSNRPAPVPAGSDVDERLSRLRLLGDVLAGPLPLSQAPPGLRVRVQKILFDVPRTRCEELGIEAGMVLRCMAWLPDGILVQAAGGETIRIDMQLADFVSVRADRARDGDGRRRGRSRRPTRRHQRLEYERGVLP